MSQGDLRMNEMLQASYPEKQTKPTGQNYNLDMLIREELPIGKQYKTARVIWRICESTNGYFSANEVAERLQKLGKSNIIQTFGNMELWAYSEVRFFEQYS